MKRGDIRLLGVASYAAPVLSTLILVAAGYARADAVARARLRAHRRRRARRDAQAEARSRHDPVGVAVGRLEAERRVERARDLVVLAHLQIGRVRALVAAPGHQARHDPPAEADAAQLRARPRCRRARHSRARRRRGPRRRGGRRGRGSRTPPAGGCATRSRSRIASSPSRRRRSAAVSRTQRVDTFGSRITDGIDGAFLRDPASAARASARSTSKPRALEQGVGARAPRAR